MAAEQVWPTRLRFIDVPVDRCDSDNGYDFDHQSMNRRSLNKQEQVKLALEDHARDRIPLNKPAESPILFCLDFLWSP